MNNVNPRDELRERIEQLQRLKVNIMYGLERGLILGNQKARNRLTNINDELETLTKQYHDSIE